MSDSKVVIALGYFDCVHKGHQLVLDEARRFAKEQGARLVVFTFKGNLKKALLENDDKPIYSPEEREHILRLLGAEEVYFAPVTQEFLSMDKRAFIDFLNEKYDIACYVSGEDYTFGRLGLGNKDFLNGYAKERGQEYLVVKIYEFEGQKISTTRIKGLLSAGDVKTANILLGRTYSVTGKVFKDRNMGSKLGFPTVNVKLSTEKFNLLDGVYKGRINIDGKEYKAIINYGARPTFSLTEKLIEAHIIDFSGDLYDREITLEFDYFMRGVKKFDNLEQLKEQLEQDKKCAKEGIYD